MIGATQQFQLTFGHPLKARYAYYYFPSDGGAGIASSIEIQDGPTYQVLFSSEIAKPVDPATRRVAAGCISPRDTLVYGFGTNIIQVSDVLTTCF